MMNDDAFRRRGPRRGGWRGAGLTAIAAGLALLTAACGSGASSGPASPAACMRAHGVTGAFAVPTGIRTSMPVLPALGGQRKAMPVPSKAAAAMRACQSQAARSGHAGSPG